MSVQRLVLGFFLVASLIAVTGGPASACAIGVLQNEPVVAEGVDWVVVVEALEDVTPDGPYSADFRIIDIEKGEDLVAVLDNDRVELEIGGGVAACPPPYYFSEGQTYQIGASTEPGRVGVESQVYRIVPMSERVESVVRGPVGVSTIAAFALLAFSVVRRRRKRQDARLQPTTQSSEWAETPTR